MSTTLYQNEQYLNSRGGFSSNYFKLRTSIYLERQSVANNTSVIRYVIELGANTTSTSSRWSNSYYYFAIDRTSNNGVSGTVYNERHASYSGSGTQYGYVTIADYQETLTHKTDGTLTVIASYSGTRTQGSNTYVPVDFTVSSGTVTVPTIARASSFTINKTSATYGDAITITITRASSSFTHTIQLSCNGDSWTNIATGVATTRTYTIPTSIASRLTASSNYIRFRVITYSETTQVGTATSSNVTITTPDNFKPAITLTTTDLSGHTSVFGGYVKGKSQIQIKTVVSLKNSATLSSHSLTNGSSTSTSTSTTLTQTYTASGATYTATAKDSRNMSGTASTTPTCYNYSNPSISNVTAHRTNSSGTADDDGAYITVSFTYSIASVNSKNTKAVSVQYKANTSSSYTTQTLTASSYSGTLSTTFSASTENTFNIIISVQDYFTTATFNTDVSTAFTLMDYGAGGKSVAIGKVSADNGNFEVAMPTELIGGLYLEGNADKVGSIYQSAYSYNASNLLTLTSATWTDTISTSAPKGVYIVFARAQYRQSTSQAGVGRRAITVNLNGSDIAASQQMMPSANGYQGVVTGVVVNATNTTNTILLRAYQDSGTDMRLNACNIQAVKIV